MKGRQQSKASFNLAKDAKLMFPKMCTVSWADLPVQMLHRWFHPYRVQPYITTMCHLKKKIPTDLTKHKISLKYRIWLLRLVGYVGTAISSTLVSTILKLNLLYRSACAKLNTPFDCHRITLFLIEYIKSSNNIHFL